jgi:hypothetical protein
MSRTPSARPRRKLIPARGVSHRLEINLPPTDIEAIRTVAALTGETTLTAVLHNALKAYGWLVMEQQRNRVIIAEDRVSGARTELMPLLRVTAL